MPDLRHVLGFCLVVMSTCLTAHAPAEAAERIAVADGVATEIVYLLGAEDRVVGVDQTSRFPPEAAEKPQLGYFRTLSAEGVLALSPDQMIVSPHAGPPSVLEQLRAAGIPIATAPDVNKLDDIAPKVRFVGRTLGLDAEAAALEKTIADEIAEIRRTVPDWPKAPKVLFVLTIQGGSPLVAGADTSPDEIIREAGAENAATFDGFKPMSQEAIVGAAPDMVMMTTEHAETLGGAAVVLQRPEFMLTPAGKTENSLTLPALTVLGIGPRSPASVRTLRDALGR
ncbi:MAG: ABC transporter substrate-binding protein [Pseudomonadota bacterium]